MDGRHKYMFDEENLIHILTSKGFKNVHQRKLIPILISKKEILNPFMQKLRNNNALNKALHLTAFPLRAKAADDLDRMRCKMSALMVEKIKANICVV